MIVVKTIKEYDNNDFYSLKENSWGGALQTLEDIENVGMEKLFMEHLEETFYENEEIEDTTLNDYIWFERGYIYECLGLDEDGYLIEESESE